MRFAAPRSHISRAVSKPPAEIVRHEIHRSPNRGGVQELFDELRQAVERTFEAGRHFRKAEAGRSGAMQRQCAARRSAMPSHMMPLSELPWRNRPAARRPIQSGEYRRRSCGPCASMDA
jgi:hypothetical protein